MKSKQASVYSVGLRCGTPRGVSPGLVCAIAASALMLGQAEAQITANYTGPNNGLWGDAANWDIGVTPINGLGGTFNAIIPSSVTVNFDIEGASELTGLNMGASSRINVAGGRSIEVLGFTGINGLVVASGPGSSFIAESAFVSFAFNGVGRAHVREGALVSLQTPSYAGSFNDSTDVFIATDAGSVLDLSSLSSLSLPSNASNSSRTFAVTASNGGQIDLSNLTSIAGAGGNNWARFNVLSGGQIDLDSLESTSGRVRFRIENPLYSLPSLAATVGASVFSVADGTALMLPALASMSGATLQIDDGGAIQAPLLTFFTNGFIDYAPDRVLVTPDFQNITNSRFFVHSGATFARVAAASYTGSFNDSTDVFIATDAGSVLDLSSLSSLSLPSNASNSSRTYAVTASNGGLIDLSNLTTIAGAGGNNWARFNVLSGGQIDLESLESTSGRVRFRVEGSLLRMPSLTEVTGASIFSVSVFNRIELPLVTSMSGATLQIDDGGTIEAPMLALFTNGFIEINPARFLITPEFQDITNSRFFVRNGGTFTRVASTSYTGSFNDSTDVFLATDAGSVLDLSSLSSLSLPSNASNSSRTYAVTASNGGLIDLSSLATIEGAGGNNWARFNVLSGGQIHIGEADMTRRILFRVDGTSSVLRFLGSVRLIPSVDLQLLGVSTMSVAGNFLFELTNASTLRLGDGVLHMNGSGTQKLEVGGADLGLPSGNIAPNFQIGQLVVGDADQSTAVVLVDMNNNGNRGPNAEPEVLYLQGFPSDDGLRILGGSTLYLNGFDAYAVIAGDWTHLNSLVPAGHTRVDYDGGWIDLEAPFECIADINGDGVVDADDFFLFLQYFAAGDVRADINCDGIIDADDFFAYLALFAAGC